MCEDFWQRVKYLIKENNTKQEWLAEISGIKYQTLRSMISKNTFPKADDAVKIAEVLNTTVEYLVNGNKDSNHEINKFYLENAKYSVFLEYLSKLNSNQIEDLETMIIALVEKKKKKKFFLKHRKNFHHQTPKTYP